jgi:hypothetical protein
MGLGSGIRDPGSGKNLFRIPDPGSRGQKGTRSRIQDPGSGSATLGSATLHAGLPDGGDHADRQLQLLQLSVHGALLVLGRQQLVRNGKVLSFVADPD